MSRRAQIILLPFLIVPLILLVVVGALVLSGGGTSTAQVAPTAITPEPAVAQVSNVTAPTPTMVPVEGTPAPVPTVSDAASSQIDAEDAIVTALYRDRAPAVVAIRVLGQQTPGDLQGLVPTPEDGQ